MDENAFDVTIVGTGLTESIIVAALAKAGLRVLHIDHSDQYGGPEASLSLIDLHHLILSPHPTLGLSDITAPVAIPAELLKDSRNYAISLAPSVLASVGPLIDTLIKSGVARYVKFKLLDRLGLYSGGSSGEKGDGSAIGTVKVVPGSKEDVFKSTELGLLQKRKLMKFLVSASTSTDEASGDESSTFGGYLRSRAVGLESSVAEAVAYALALSTDPNEPKETAMKRLQKYIRSTGRHGNSPFLVGHFGGAGEVAQGFCRAAAVAGATYILGRPFTIKSSEPSSSRAGEGSEDLKPAFELRFEGLEDTLTSRLLISRKNSMPQDLVLSGDTPEVGDAGASKRLARCIAILNEPIYFARRKPANEEDGEEAQAEMSEEDEEDILEKDGTVDSVVLVFPPNSLTSNTSRPASDGITGSGVVTALIAGPNAMACPEGKHIVYISTEMSNDSSPEETLQPYLSAIQCLNRHSSDSTPILASVFYSEVISSSTSSKAASGSVGNGLIFVNPPTQHLAEAGDEASDEAESVFWRALGILDLDGRSRGDDEVQADEAQPAGSAQMIEGSLEVDKVTIMWPRLTVEDNPDEEW